MHCSPHSPWIVATKVFFVAAMLAATPAAAVCGCFHGGYLGGTAVSAGPAVVGSQFVSGYGAANYVSPNVVMANPVVAQPGYSPFLSSGMVTNSVFTTPAVVTNTIPASMLYSGTTNGGSSFTNTGVSNTALQNLETRIMDRFDDLESRLDNRIDELKQQVTQLQAIVEGEQDDAGQDDPAPLPPPGETPFNSSQALGHMLNQAALIQRQQQLINDLKSNPSAQQADAPSTDGAAAPTSLEGTMRQVIEELRRSRHVLQDSKKSLKNSSEVLTLQLQQHDAALKDGATRTNSLLEARIKQLQERAAELKAFSAESFE